jgi:GNAT superfamily N-acetyltransferase
MAPRLSAKEKRRFERENGLPVGEVDDLRWPTLAADGSLREGPPHRCPRPLVSDEFGVHRPEQVRHFFPHMAPVDRRTFENSATLFSCGVVLHQHGFILFQCGRLEILHFIWVHPNHRRRGIASRMLRYFEAQRAVYRGPNPPILAGGVLDPPFWVKRGYRLLNEEGLPSAFRGDEEQLQRFLARSLFF